MKSTHMLIWSVSKEEVFPDEKTGTRRDGESNSTRTGHVTLSLLTDDELEIQ